MDLLQIKEKLKICLEQIKEMKEQLQEKDQEIKKLRREVVESQTKYDEMVVAKTLASNSKEAKRAQQRLSRLVRKIDRCVDLLNKQ